MSGHVDGLGSIQSVSQVGEYQELWFRYPPEFKVYLIPKGSITVDGVSLTVNELRDQETLFSVMLIPHTIENTVFRKKGAGDTVHLEFDAMGKYMLRAATNQEKSVEI